MGKLDDALEEAGQESGGTASGGLGAAVKQEGVDLQEDDPGATAEEQIAGEGTLPDQEGSGQKGRTMPTET